MVAGACPYTYRRAMEVTTWGEELDWRWPDMMEDTLYHLPSFDLAAAQVFWTTAPFINAVLGCTFYEGVVAKRCDSLYPVQLRSAEEETSAWVKHRFTTK